jgi:hypothetical protein
MIYDLANYKHDYSINDGKIVYKLQDGVTTKIVHGYKTMFAYYDEKE